MKKRKREITHFLFLCYLKDELKKSLKKKQRKKERNEDKESNFVGEERKEK